MKKDLFGKPATKRMESILVFHDERRYGKEWLYHGLLAIPVGNLKDVLREMNLCRDSAKYYRELHFCKITDKRFSNKIKLAREWIRFFRNKFFYYGYLYFFGVCCKNINYDVFGDSKDKRSQKDFRIYNRFFEMALFSMLRFFFKNQDKVIVSEIFSHASDRPEEDPFPHHPIYKIKKRKVKNIHIDTSRVTQISSNHEKEDAYSSESQCIQFIDCIIGAIGQVLDCSSKKECFVELGDLTLPLVREIISNPYNWRSDYYKRYILNFFPRKALEVKEIYSEPRPAMFFYKRNLKLTNKDQLDFGF
jgi:hypothetical protein